MMLEKYLDLELRHGLTNHGTSGSMLSLRDVLIRKAEL
jgi:hypothetical protein